MKPLRFGEPGGERPAVLLDDSRAADVSSLISDIDGYALGPAGLEALERRLADHGTDLPVIDLGATRVGPPLSHIGKIVCVGLNYAEHADEAGQRGPEEPVLFLKSGDTVVGPTDPVLVPPRSTKTDYKVELALVVGRTARYLSQNEDALSYVAGYTISNDVSEREYQLERGGQWDKGKNCETFNPLGPSLVARDEIGDPGALHLELKINTEVRQDASAGDMIFGVEFLVRYISQFMVLYPGDVINTGTPRGVGAGFTPPRFLREGDVAGVSISGLGTQRTQFRQANVQASR